jgi:hypothetical protein
MSDCKKCRALFADALYAELSDEKKRLMEDHLRDCSDCRSEFEELSTTLKIMKKRVRNEPDPSFWDGYWNRLATRIENENVLDVHQEKPRKSLVPQRFFIPRWAFQAAAAVVLIVAGIFIGKVLFSPQSPGTQFVASSQSSTAAPIPAEFVSRTQSYIERSKLMFLAIVNFDPQTEDPYILNLPFQQQVSRELIQEASWLKNELSDSRQRRLQELITDLEVILLQIANLESESDLEAIDLVKSGVESRGIFLKINLADIRRSTNNKNNSKSF